MNKKYFLIVSMALASLNGCVTSPNEDLRVLSLDNYKTIGADVYATPNFSNVNLNTYEKEEDKIVSLKEGEIILYEWKHKYGGEPLSVVYWSGTDMKCVIPSYYSTSVVSMVQDVTQYFEYWEQFPAGDEQKIVSPELFSYAPVGSCLEPKMKLYYDD